MQQIGTKGVQVKVLLGRKGDRLGTEQEIKNLMILTNGICTNQNV